MHQEVNNAQEETQMKSALKKRSSDVTTKEECKLQETLNEDTSDMNHQLD